MRDAFFTTCCRTALLSALALVSPFAHSQDEPAQRWFRVELMIISHESPSAETAERWAAEPVLAYPPSYRFLVDAKKIDQNLKAYPGESEIDDRGVQTITMPGDEPEEAVPDIPQKTDPDGTEDAPAVANPAIEPLTPEPFTVRPASELEFRGKAAYMQRTGRFRTLFHQTWLQPMSSEAETLPIVIDHSGDDENWPRLQGSVKLYLSRYLHLETNLWLNTAGNYLPADWTMPAPPFGPQSLVVIEPPVEPENKVFDPQPAMTVATEESDELTGEALGPVSPWRHAVLMQQKRRMRSQEVHYIDHPMLGVVVKLMPVSAQELEDIALADAAAAES